MKGVGLTKYAKNLIKSTNYAAVDVIKETMPNVTEFMENNNDLFRDISETIRNRRTIFGKVSTQMKNSKIYETVEEATHNIMEDIRTGNLYNKDPIRERRINKKSGMDSLLGEDFDFDFDFDDSFSFDDDDTAELAFAIDDSNRTSSDMVATTIARTSSNQIQSNKMMNQMTLLQMQEGFTTVNSNLGNLSSVIAGLGNEMNSISQNIADNSKTFFEKSTEFQASMVSYLKELVDIQKKINGLDKNSESSNDNNKPKSFGDVSTYDGMPDIKAYGNLLKNRLADNLSFITDMNSMMGENTNMSMQFAMSPLAFLPKIVVKQILGPTLQKSATELDTTLSNVFGTFISSMNEIADNSGFMDIKGMVAKFFGLNDSIKSIKSIDTSYNKENKPWNGKAEKALTEVIPTLLAKILAVQSGSSELTYNYDNGKFVTVSKLKEELTNREKNEINNSFYDIRNAMTNMMDDVGLYFDNEQTKKEFQKDYDRFFEYFFKSNNRFNPAKKNYEDYYDLGISRENYAIIETLYNRLDPSIKMGMDRNKLRGRQSLNDFYSNIGKNNEVYRILNNGSDLVDTSKFKSNLALSTDEKGKNLFWYLDKILSTLKTTNTVVQNIDDSTTIEQPENRPTNTMYNNGRYFINRFGVNTENALSYNDLAYNRSDNDTISGILNTRLDIEDEAKRIREEEYNRTIIDDLLESENVSEKAKTLFKRMKSVKQAPTSMLAKMMDKVNLKIYETMYGNIKYKGKDVNGIVGVMMENITESFEKFNTFLDEKVLVPLKDKLDKNGGVKGIIKNTFGIDLDQLKEKMFGKDSIFGKTVKTVKDDIKNLYNYSKDSFTNTYKEIYDKLGGNDYNSKFNKIIDTIRYGKKNREGMYIVDSEGQLNILNRVKKVKNTQQTNLSETNNEEFNSSITGQLSLFRPDEQSAINEAARNLNTTVEDIANALNNGLMDSHDKGGVINKTKIALIHEGEEVIRKEDRQKIYNKRGLDYSDTLRKSLNTGDDSNLNSSDKKILDFIRNIDESNFTSIKESLGKEFTSTTVEDLQNEIIDSVGYKKGQPTLFEEMKETASSGINKVVTTLFGNPDDGEEVTKKGKDALKDLFNKFKDYLPSGISGALLGSVAGGFVGLPLVGAALGSSFNIIKKSDKLQEYLFGDMGEDGKRLGNGKLPEKMVNAMNKYAPDMKKYGITGAITSILPFVPGGPVAGLLLGAGVGFAKNNAQIQDFLFGEMGVLKGFKGKGENFKKALPKMGLGAATLALTGPFGLIGNAMLGAGIGFVTQTNKFQEFMFGKDGVDEEGKPTKIGGFLPMIRDKVIDPIKDFGSSLKDKIQNFVEEEIRKPFHSALSPFVEEFKNSGKKLFNTVKDSITSTIDKIFTKTVGVPLSELIEEKIVKPVGGIFKKLFSVFGKLAGGVLKIPTNIMTSMADSLRLKHIKEGNSSYITDEELVKLQQNRPFDYMMATHGDRLIHAIKNNGLKALFRSNKELETIQDNKKLTFREKVNNLVNKKMESYNNKHKEVTEKITSKYSKMKDQLRNSAQNLRTKAYMTSANIMDNLADRAENGGRYRKAMTRESQTESEGDSKTEDSNSVVDRVKKSPSVKSVNVKSVEVEALKKQVEELNKELVVLQARKEEKENNESIVNNKTNDLIKDIRNEVYGQFDGIGYNVHTIANILVEQFGLPKIKATGAKVSRGNLKRKMWFERLFSVILNPARKVKDALNNLLWGKKGDSGLLGTPLRWAKTALNNISKVGKVIGNGIGHLLNLGGNIIKGFGIVGNIFKDSIAALAPAFGELLKGTAQLITLPIKALSGAIEGVGHLFGSIAKGVGILGGKMIEMVGLIPSLITNIGHLTIEIGKFGIKLAKSIGTVLMKPFTLLFDSITGKKKSKNKKTITEFKLTGGFLDEIKKPIDLNGAQERHKGLLTFFENKFNTLFSILGKEPENTDNIKFAQNSDNYIPEKETIKLSETKLLPEPKDSVTSLPTEFGVIRYDKDASGELRPIQDRVFSDYKEKLEKDDNDKDAMFNLINTGDSEERSNKENGKKVSWISKIANSIGSVLTNGIFLKTVGAGLMAGALVDLVKNGENSFLGKGVMFLKDKVLPPIRDFCVNTLVPSLGKAIADAIHTIMFGSDSTPEYTDEESGLQYDTDTGKVVNSEGETVLKANKFGNNFANTLISVADGAKTFTYKMLTGKDKMGWNEYTKNQFDKVSKFASTVGMTEEQLKTLEPELKKIYKYRRQSAMTLPWEVNNYWTKNRNYLTDNVDILGEYLKTEEGKQVLNEAIASGKIKPDDPEYSKYINQSTNNEFGFGKKPKHRIGQIRNYGLGNTFYSQNDPRWAGMSFNSKGDTERQTIADSGCGPVAASMVANDYQQSNPVEASKFALDNGYKEQNGGTEPEFFKDYFNRKGIESDIDNDVQNNSQKKQSIIDNLKQNKPVILMGKSKGGNTPYGKEYPHYVVATGMRGNNLVINDPYSNKGGELYNLKDTLNSSSISIRTGRGKKYGRVGVNVSNSLNSDGNMASGNKAFEFVKDINTAFTGAIGEIFGIDLFSSSSSNSSGGVTGSISIGSNQYDSSVVAQVINNFFKNSTKLKNKGDAFVRIAQSASHDGYPSGIDPLFFAAIVMQETGGSSNALNNKNNPGGMMDPSTNWSKLKHYNTVEDGLTDMAKTVHRIWTVEGKSSIEQFGSVYCPVGAANDPNGLNKHWVPNVTKYYNQLLDEVVKAGGVTSGGSGAVYGSNELGKKIAQTAISYIGKGGYVMGGTDLEHGVDCSGFSQGIYAKCGISIQRTASGQQQQKEFVTVGTSPSYQAEAGDLIFFQGTYKAGVSHVGICTGNGDEFIESGGSDGTKIRSAHYHSNYNTQHFHSIARHKSCMSNSGKGKTNKFGKGKNFVIDNKHSVELSKTHRNRTGYIKNINKMANESIMYGKGINDYTLSKTNKTVPKIHKTISKMVYGIKNTVESHKQQSIANNKTNSHKYVSSRVSKSPVETFKEIKEKIISNNARNNDIKTVYNEQKHQGEVINSLIESQNNITNQLQSINTTNNNILKDIYALLLILVNNGVDIKNLDKILKAAGISNTSILSMISNNDIESPSSQMSNKELIHKFKELAK